MNLQRSGGVLFAFCASCLLCVPAFSQPFPTRSIVFIVPVAPGGGVDFMSRVLAPKLAEALKQTVVVENRPGAANAIGSEFVARSKPDGHTLMMANNSSHGVSQAFEPKLPYDSIRDFTPVSVIGTAEHLLVINPKLPVGTLREFIELARAKPGQLNYGSSGAGTQTHLSTELFKFVTNIDIVHIPYKGTGPTYSALLGGEIQFMFGSSTGATPFVRDGRLKALAITGSKRADALPDVPTLDSQGIKGYESGAWYAVLGPAGIPRSIVMQLNQEIVRIVKSDDFRQRVGKEGVEPQGSTPEAALETIRNEVAKWTGLVKETGLKVN